VETDNTSVLAFLRVLALEDAGTETPETVLCVNNLAQTPQATTVRLDEHAGRGLTDLFGGGGFPAVSDDGSLTLSLGSRDFFWLRVDPDGTA
jgi:maltose alpha-D-glucosyltransferase/alpha-amylase